MNKKGMTLVELITTFALASTIIFLLINIVLSIKNIYFNYDLKTNLYINQANLSNALNKEFTSGNLISIDGLNTNFTFVFNDGIKELKVEENKIKFGDYVYKLDSGSYVKVEDFYVTNESINGENKFLVINIPIESKIFKNENFGVKIVYPY